MKGFNKNTTNDSLEKKANKAFLFSLFDNQAILFEDKINLINHEHIKILDETAINSSLLFSESFAEMYYNFTIIRRILNNNINFTRLVISILAKIVHPNIQLFYGIMLDKEFMDEFISTNESHESTKHLERSGSIKILSKPQTSVQSIASIPIILEYVDGIDLKNFSSLYPILSVKERIYLKLIILKKICETVTFLHKSGYPHLILNGKNIKINYHLIKDAGKLIFSGNSYAEANFLKITEVGSFYKYSYSMQFTLETEMFYEQSYHSPYLFQLFDSNYDFTSDLGSLLKNDFWSFGCIIYELFTDKQPFENIEQGVSFKDLLLNNFFSSSGEVNKDLFVKFHAETLGAFKESLLESFESKQEQISHFYDKLYYLISLCTYGGKNQKFTSSQGHTKFEDFNEIIGSLLSDYNEIIKVAESAVEEDDKLRKYRPYINFNLNKYIDIVELDELIVTNQKILEEVKEKTREYDEMEHSLKIQLKQQENNSLISKYNTTANKNLLNKIFFFMDKQTKDFVFNFDNNTNKGYSLDIYNLKELHSTQTSNLKRTKAISTQNEINFLLENKIWLSETSAFYSFNKQRLYCSGGQLRYSSNGKIVEDPKIKALVKRSNKIYVIYTDKYSHNMSTLRTKEVILTNELSQGNSENTKQYFVGDLGNMLIKRSKHSMIDYNDYLFIIGGDQDRKCEILDMVSGNTYFIDDLNTIHINPILYFIGDVLYSFNFEGLMIKLKELFYHQEEDKSKKKIKTSSIDIKRPNLMQLNSSFSSTNIQGFIKTRSKQSFDNTSVNLGSVSYKTENLEEDEDFKNEDIVVLEKLKTSELNTITPWSICSVNLDALLIVEPVQFTYYNYFQLMDYIYIFGCESLTDLENKWMYYIKFHTREMRFENSKPVPANNKFNIFKNSLLMNSNIIADDGCFYFFDSKNQRVEKVPFKDITL